MLQKYALEAIGLARKGLLKETGSLELIIRKCQSDQVFARRFVKRYKRPIEDIIAFLVQLNQPIADKIEKEKRKANQARGANFARHKS